MLLWTRSALAVVLSVSLLLSARCQTTTPTNIPLSSTTVTVTGSAFGASDSSPTVALNSKPCSTSAWVSSSSLLCSRPLGVVSSSVGWNVTTVVNNTALERLSSLTLDAPVLTYVAPSNSPVSGSAPVTVNGLNFGDTALSPTLLPAGGPCITTTWVSSSTLTCRTSSGYQAAGSGQAILMSVASQTGTLTAAFQLDPVSPSLASATPSNAASSGGTHVTLTGSSLGWRDLSPTASLGDRLCHSTSWVSRSSIMCATSPPHSGFARASVALPSAVTASASPTLLEGAVGLDAPVLSSILPLNAATSGGASLTLSGMGFMATSSSPTASITAPCATTAWASASSVHCLSAPAFGMAIALSLTVASSSTTAATLLTSDAPRLTALTPTNLPDAGGATVTLAGFNFAPAANASLGQSACQSTVFVSPQELRCTTAPGSGGSLPVTLTVPDGRAASLGGAAQYDSYCATAWDVCGVCGGDNTTCLGCDGVPNGASLDACGVCGGDGSLCAPLLVAEARFSPAMRSLDVLFTHHGDASLTPCNVSLIFTAATAAKFGPGAWCLWRSPSLFSVLFTPGWTLQPGDTLVFLSQWVLRRPSPSTAGPFDTAATPAVLAPHVSLTVAAVLSTPRTFTSCGTLIMDSELSIGRAGRPWAGVEWSLVSSPSAAFAAVSTRIARFNTTRVRVASDDWGLSGLLPAGQYVFAVRMVNWLGDSGEASAAVSVVDRMAVGVVVVGHGHTRRAPAETIAIEGRVSLPSCLVSVQTYTYSFLWRVQPTPLLAFDASVRDLVLPRFALLPGTSYNVSLTATASNGGQTPFVDSADLVLATTAPQPPVAHIQHHDRVVSLDASSLVLDASLSVDPDRQGITHLTFAWTCEVAAQGAPSPSSSFGPCSASLQSAVSVQASVLTLATSLLQLGADYRFGVQVTSSTPSGALSASDTATVRVRTTTPPLVYFPSPLNVNPGTQLSLPVDVVIAAGRNASMQWTAQSSVGETNLLGLTGFVALPASTTLPTLVLSPTALVGGRVYTFTLTVTDGEGLVGTRDVAVAANLPPSLVSGGFSATPTAGVAVQTLFSFVAGVWADEDRPVMHAFKSARPGGALATFSDFALLNYVDNVVLPSGSSAAASVLTVYLEVQDSLGATASRALNLTVAPFTSASLSGQSVSDYVSTTGTSAASLLLQQGNAQAAVRLLTSLVDAVNLATASSSSSRSRGRQGDRHPLATTASVPTGRMHTAATTASAQLRENLLDLLVRANKARSPTSDFLSAVAVALAGIAARPADLSSKAQNDTLSLVTSLISDQRGIGAADSTVLNTTKQLLAAVGAVGHARATAPTSAARRLLATLSSGQLASKAGFQEVIASVNALALLSMHDAAPGEVRTLRSSFLVVSTVRLDASTCPPTTVRLTPDPLEPWQYVGVPRSALPATFDYEFQTTRWATNGYAWNGQAITSAAVVEASVRPRRVATPVSFIGGVNASVQLRLSSLSSASVDATTGWVQLDRTVQWVHSEALWAHTACDFVSVDGTDLLVTAVCVQRDWPWVFATRALQADCGRLIGGSQVLDSCGVCGGLDAAVDTCGVCFGNDATCSGHGICSPRGPGNPCACVGNWGGTPTCSSCSPHWYGAECGVYCKAADTCYGHGTCDTSTGACVCSPRWGQFNCQGCAAGHYGPTCSVTCSEALCNFRGYCHPQTGACQCAGNTLGAKCDVCVTDYYGSSCTQYCQALISCSGHGTCSAATGACVCATGFGSASCAVCQPDLYGPSCSTRCTPETCSYRGSCHVNTGECVCFAPFAGSSCTACVAGYYTASCDVFCAPASTCNSHGSCSASSGTCECMPHWASASACAECDTHWYDQCRTFCEPSVTCSGHGACTSLGTCLCAGVFTGASCAQCVTGFFGAQCSIACNAGTCSGHGSCSPTGSCVCSVHFAGQFCGACTADRFGTSCVTYCNAQVTCNGHGACSVSGACACTNNFAGTVCSVCESDFFGPNCDVHCVAGVTCLAPFVCRSDSGECQCSGNLAPPLCVVCLPGHYQEHVECRVACSAEAMLPDGCSGHGQCDVLQGIPCVCDSSDDVGYWDGDYCERCQPDYYGANCDVYCRLGVNCEAPFVCEAVQGRCACPGNFAGAACTQCKAQYYGTSCSRFCDSSLSCNSHGACNDFGRCVCTGTFEGSDCTLCAEDYYTAFCNIKCTALTTCSARGTCHAATGACVCSGTFAGDACTLCMADYYGDFCGRYCDPATTCNGRGSCDAAGACQCTGYFAGDACELCVAHQYPAGLCSTRCEPAETCRGHGTCNHVGQCECALAWTGVSCGKCAPTYYGLLCDRVCTASTCGANGACGPDGLCVCSGTFAGVTCNECLPSFYPLGRCSVFCDAPTTCLGHGRCTNAGACACFSGFTTAASTTTSSTTSTASVYCDVCLPDLYGHSCNVPCTAAVTCRGHGVCTSEGTCSCAANFVGDDCSLCQPNRFGSACTTVCIAAVQCRSRGACGPSGACVCRPEFAGLDCSECAAHHYGSQCQRHCVPSDHCSGHGECNTAASGQLCTCEANWFGQAVTASCSRYCTPVASCGGVGQCDASSGACVCPAARAGTACERCAPNLYGSSCNRQCVASRDCNAHGECDVGRESDTLFCLCDDGWAPPYCAVCAAQHYGASCVFCDAATSCYGGGSCAADGTCSCRPKYYGRYCSVFCDGNTTCSGHGVCSGSGKECYCAKSWFGSSCNQKLTIAGEGVLVVPLGSAARLQVDPTLPGNPWVDIPQGAVTSTTTFSISLYSPPPFSSSPAVTSPSNRRILSQLSHSDSGSGGNGRVHVQQGSAITCRPVGHMVGLHPYPYTFQTPVTIALPFDESLLPPASGGYSWTPYLYAFNNSAQKYLLLHTTRLSVAEGERPRVATSVVTIAQFYVVVACPVPATATPAPTWAPLQAVSPSPSPTAAPMRRFNDLEQTPAPVSAPIAPDPTLAIGLAFGISLPVLLVLALIAIILFKRRRRFQQATLASAFVPAFDSSSSATATIVS